MTHWWTVRTAISVACVFVAAAAVSGCVAERAVSQGAASGQGFGVGGACDLFTDTELQNLAGADPSVPEESNWPVGSRFRCVWQVGDMMSDGGYVKLEVQHSSAGVAKGRWHTPSIPYTGGDLHVADSSEIMCGGYAIADEAPKDKYFTIVYAPTDAVRTTLGPDPDLCPRLAPALSSITRNLGWTS